MQTDQYKCKQTYTSPTRCNGGIVDLHHDHNLSDDAQFENCFYAPKQKVARVLCYTVRNFECPSVCPSVRQPFHHSCLLHNSDTVGGIFTILHTNVKHYETTCRTREQLFCLPLLEILPLEHKHSHFYYVFVSVLSLKPHSRYFHETLHKCKALGDSMQNT